MVFFLLCIDFLEKKNKDDVKNKNDDKKIDEATPLETKRLPFRRSSEKAKKRLK